MNGPNPDQMPRDEDIHGADSFQELRRLKRLRMWETSDWTLWRNTPSPPPGATPPDSDEEEEEEEEEAAPGPQQQQNGGGAGDMPPPPPRPPKALKGHAAADAAKAVRLAKELEKHKKELDALEEQEVELFRAWYSDIEESKAAAEAEMARAAEENALVGPSLPGARQAAGGAAGNYGGFLLPGEGDRMAQYVASGKRIPRRGEVGLSSDQIEHYEQLGYIMSGSRHSRMNAIRIRKENQIYSAEEKAALAMFNYEENKTKEAKILEDMKRLVDKTMGPPGDGTGFAAGGTEGGGAE
ncbi:MAG: ras-induced vulval development antagonist-domain-containing protein [Monoraphidium minutum]|nr:MAG: ras-induced vulval development antagonist-domain-containing protein [Monoraphidium minutum]